LSVLHISLGFKIDRPTRCSMINAFTGSTLLRIS
jgi:hypothetical protein